MTDIEQAAALRHELALIKAARPGQVWLLVYEDEIRDLAADCVPQIVRAMARMSLEDDDAKLRRNAAKPVRKGGSR